jgi:hypothetical protein
MEGGRTIDEDLSRLALRLTLGAIFHFRTGNFRVGTPAYVEGLKTMKR